MRSSDTSKILTKFSMTGRAMVHEPYTSLYFNKIEEQAEHLANIIETRLNKLIDILLKYESYEVVKDEIGRTLDLLRNLEENKKYFKLRVGPVAAFLPRNQPFYAFSCFVIVPSLMASEVHFRIPHSMHHFFSEMLELLDIFTLFPNIILSNKERIEFLKDRSALLVNPKTGESRPITEVVIFTGTPAHADQLRLVFDRRTLFIANGAGHNPVVISKDADISKSVEAVLSLGLYNQGQDCAAPNAILVHQNVYKKFLNLLHTKLSKVKIGPYHDHSSRVGPISDPTDLKRIESLIMDNRQWLDNHAGGVIRISEAIVEPTIICKPLREGGNYKEVFAPIFFIQQYSQDKDLVQYFENQQYSQNAMYVMLYGKSTYVKNFIDKRFAGKILLDKSTFLHNTHLHEAGVERGTQAYGGYGRGSSSISINGKIISKPTLPQRDIFEWIVKPLDKTGVITAYKKILAGFTEIQYKNVAKLLRISIIKAENQNQTIKTSNNKYFDLGSIKTNGLRYVEIEENSIYHLLNEPNVEYVANLEAADLELIHSLRILIDCKSEMSLEEFLTHLYAIPKKNSATKTENEKHQLRFFQHIYQLLFGKSSGPRLGPFLWELKASMVDKLLDV